MRYVIIAWVIATASVAFGAEPAAVVLPSRAIVRKVDVMPPHPEIVISDPAQLTKLLSFFVDFQQEQKSDLAGAWMAKYWIVLHFRGRPAVKVVTSYDGEIWSSGNGDRPLKAGLSAFLDPMFGKR